jgi:uncharacterized membrane protein HdeD (DUF308 family)
MAGLPRRVDEILPTRLPGTPHREGSRAIETQRCRSSRRSSRGSRTILVAMADTTAAARGMWWLVLLRGILAILFGLFALFAPGTALLALVFVFAAYAVLDGVTALLVGIRHRKDDPHWGWHVVQGVVSVLAGIIAFVLPGVTVLAILFVIAFWSIVGGIAEVVESFMMRKRGSEGWGWMLAAGIVSVLFGIVLLVSPGAALITLLWLVGVYAIVFGVIIVVWAVRLRRAVGAAVKG